MPTISLRPAVQAAHASRLPRVLRRRQLGHKAVAILAVALAGRADGAPDAGARGQVRGVAAADQAKYAPSLGDGGVPTFRCLNSLAGAPSLPFSSVNDDFCDCTDGSDEPGTSACAGQKETLFYCINAGSDAAFIYTSHVNDGICDCCDGSDEWPSSAARAAVSCPNKCAEEGRERQRERKRLEADLRSGIKQRRSLIQAAKAKQQSDSKELERLQQELPSLEEEERQATAKLEAAQKAHEEAEQQKAAAASPGNSTGAGADPEARPSPEPGDAAGSPGAEAGGADAVAPAPGGGPVVSEYTKWMEGAEQQAGGDASGSTNAQESSTGGSKGEGAVISEYTKWMDGAEEALKETDGQHDAEEAEAELDAEAEAEVAEAADELTRTEAMDEEDANFFVRQWRKFAGGLSGMWQRVWGPGKTPTERALDQAKEAQRKAKKLLTDNKARTNELQKKMSSMTDEDSLAYSGLDGRCISKKLTDYKYEVCFFSTAKQDSVSIGRWKDWEKPGVGLFDGGQYCPGGPERSLRVRFNCASREELLDVTEPSRCAYEAKLAHPGACTEALLQELESKTVRMPTDEL